MRLAVLASGEGTNLQAILAAGLPVAVLLTDRPGAACVARAERAGVPVEEAPGPPRDADPAARQAYDADLVRRLAAHDVDTVALAGFLRVLSPAFLAAFPGRVYNVHPSLLPAFPGLHAVRRALARGVRVTGVTVHRVDEGVDTGPIVAQEAVPVRPDDDEAALLRRLHAVEHRLYPEVLRAVAEGRAP